MSEITNQIPAVVDVKAIRDAGKGKGIQLFGIRLRSTGFTWSIAPNKIDDIVHNAKVAADMVRVFDDKLKKLQDLGKKAEENGRAAQARYDTARKEFDDIAAKVTAESKRYEDLDAKKKDAEAARDAAQSALDNADPEDPNAQAAARATLAQRQRELDSITKDWEGAKYYVDNGERLVNEANDKINAAVADINAANADMEAVNKASEEFEKVIPGVLAEIGEEMGLKDVFIYENKKDKDGKYTNDEMSFTDKASTLLQVWGSAIIDGVELDLKDEKTGKVTPAEEDPRLINPLTRERYKTLEVKDDKAKIKNTEAIIVRHMGALQMYRKMFQTLFEQLTAIATKRNR